MVEGWVVGKEAGFLLYPFFSLILLHLSSHILAHTLHIPVASSNVSFYL